MKRVHKVNDKFLYDYQIVYVKLKTLPTMLLNRERRIRFIIPDIKAIKNWMKQFWTKDYIKVTFKASTLANKNKYGNYYGFEFTQGKLLPEDAKEILTQKEFLKHQATKIESAERDISAPYSIEDLQDRLGSFGINTWTTERGNTEHVSVQQIDTTETPTIEELITNYTPTEVTDTIPAVEIPF